LLKFDTVIPQWLNDRTLTQATSDGPASAFAKVGSLLRPDQPVLA